MPDSNPSRWLVFVMFGALTALGCVGTSSDTPQGETGSLSVELVLSNGVEIDKVVWEITGNDMEMSGDIDVSAPGSTASVEVFGLPPNDGVGDEEYVVELSAVSVDGKVACRGSAPFDVEIGKSTDVMVMLNCKLPETLGGVRVNGKFNVCAELEKVVVSPLQTSVGNDIDLSALGVDADGDAIKYIWIGDGGSIDDPSAPNTTYTCEEVGKHSVTILVTDNDVYCRMATWTVPVTCVKGDGGNSCDGVVCVGDGNQCTATECNPANGMCETSNVEDGTQCEIVGIGDGVCSSGDCVEVDLCDGVECPDDGNECTTAECNAANGMCETSNVDNGTECEGGEGMCVDGDCVLIIDKCSEVICDDTGNDCTEEKCNSETGMCDTMNVSDGTECNGGAGACSAGDCVDNNMCAGVECPSDNDCVQDGTCDPADGMCIAGDNESVDTACASDGGTVCDGNGACVECNSAGQCADDGNDCTAAACESNACVQNDVMEGQACDFGGSDGICEAGTCVDAPQCVSPGDCNDGNPCTLGACPDGMCVFTSVDGGTCEVSAGVPGTCSGGGCVGLCVGEDCASSSQCVMDGTCDDQTGECVAGDNEPADTACTESGGSVCDGAGNCVECNNDGQCDTGESCIDQTCMAVAQACGAQSKTVQVGCTNSLTDAQSPFPFTLSVDAPVAISGGGAFAVTLDGVGLFPQFFLDAAQGSVPGGVRAAELVDFVSTVQVRSGATGADVPLGIDVASLDPGAVSFCTFPTDRVCTVDGDCIVGPCLPPVLIQNVPTLDGIPGSAGGCDSNGGTQVPPDCDCSPCTAIDPTAEGQCTTNGFCVTGPILVAFEAQPGNYTAGASGEVLWGWSDVAALCPGATCTEAWMIDGCLDIPPPGATRPTFLSPAEPIGIRVTVPGLNIPIQCSMGNDGGECELANAGTGVGCLTDADCGTGETCVGVGVDDDIICPTPDSDLIACPIN